ncbi:hypothetical protein N8T08_010728 [Aspergillus melleus]|uniref:Uncharacterized protein n=1 Tax=Aspergillus melleus TaxID=138277 RepID=A0ACC3BBK7_9EURO|nr:hypothetical protein N8T08_010728 [Aspergillus melleus]
MYNRSYLYPNARQRGPDPFASGMSERDLQPERQARQQAADRQAAYDGPPPVVSWDNWYGLRGNVRYSDSRDATFRRVER